MASRHPQLPEKIGMYLDRLRQDVDIDEVWLFAAPGPISPANDGVRDLLLFASAESLATLRSDRSLERDDVNLAVVADGERYEPVWGEAPSKRLSDIGWRVEGPQRATYVAPDGDAQAERLTAVRVR